MLTSHTGNSYDNNHANENHNMLYTVVDNTWTLMGVGGLNGDNYTYLTHLPSAGQNG